MHESDFKFASSDLAFKSTLPSKQLARHTSRTVQHVHRIWRTSAFQQQTQKLLQNHRRFLSILFPLQNNKKLVLLVSTLMVTLFPMYKAPIICKTGISRGKLNGLIITTGPYLNANMNRTKTFFPLEILRPAISRAHLSHVISGICESASQKTNSIARKIVQEIPSYSDLLDLQTRSSTRNHIA